VSKVAPTVLNISQKKSHIGHMLGKIVRSSFLSKRNRLLKGQVRVNYIGYLADFVKIPAASGIGRWRVVLDNGEAL
jgi:hypothetical protein